MGYGSQTKCVNLTIYSDNYFNLFSIIHLNRYIQFFFNGQLAEGFYYIQARETRLFCIGNTFFGEKVPNFTQT